MFRALLANGRKRIDVISRTAALLFAVANMGHGNVWWTGLS